MNQNARTLVFFLTALGSVAMAAVTSWVTRPTPVEGFGRVGQPFFPDLTDPNAATGLEVVAVDEKTAEAKMFAVEFKDGAWRIPSRHNYPADGKDRLAQTATSLIGVTRGALASRLPADHKRLGVIDPLDEDAESIEGRGQRLTVYKEGKVKLADLIIGKKVADREGDYYVRRPDEADTYIASLKIDVSTKFSDWVESDLLKLERDNLVRIEQKNYSVSQDDKLTETVEATLTREKFSDPWVLADLKADSEEVNQDNLREMVNVLDNLKLTGIRPRPKPLGAELDSSLRLKVPKAARENPALVREIIAQIQNSLGSRGFFIHQDQDSGDLSLLSDSGELTAATNDGVRFHLSFGSVFEGSDEEIEIGATATEEKKAEDAKAADAKEQKPADPPGTDAKKDEDAPVGKKSRYLFVRTSFDPGLLGPPLLEPVKPVVPDGVKVDADGKPVEDAKPAEQPAGKKDDAQAAKDESADDKAAPAADAAKKDEAAQPTGDKPADAAAADAPKPDPAAEYRKAWDAYLSAKTKYDADVKALDEKVKTGEKKIDELNARFSDWYYVISAEDFDKLRLPREKIVKLKEKAEPSPADAASPASPDAKPAATPDAGAKPEAGTKPESAPKAEESAAPAKDAAAPADKPADAKPADSKPAEAKPATEAKPAETKPAEADKPVEATPASEDK